MIPNASGNTAPPTPWTTRPTIMTDTEVATAETREPTVHLLVLAVFVALLLDSRRLHALARSTGRARHVSARGHGIPAGANPDQVGLPLRQIQMRLNVDWADGGLGWDGPEILPADDSDGAPVDTDTAPDGTRAGEESEPNRALPVLWQPFRALPPGAQACQLSSTTSSPTVTRPPHDAGVSGGRGTPRLPFGLILRLRRVGGGLERRP